MLEHYEQHHGNKEEPRPNRRISKKKILLTISIILVLAFSAVFYSDRVGYQLPSPSSPSPSPFSSLSQTPTMNPRSSSYPMTTPTLAPTPAPTQVSLTQQAINEMIFSLNNSISWTLTSLIDDMPRNPNITSYIQAKITLLQDPNLYSKIVSGNFFVVDSVVSTNGHQTVIIAVYPASDMRVGAAQAVQSVKLGIPILESFMALPFPRTQIRIWYGFQVGGAGADGTIYAEDQVSYESRFREGMLPYELLFYHELSHSYIGHESLNQFLELYQYNLVHTGSTAYQDWTNYRVPKENWPWINAILDIYQLIGNDAMANAYRILYTMNPPYGQSLSQQCQQVFVDQAPADLKSQVATLAAKITY
jgi:hypothetical protein